MELASATRSGSCFFPARLPSATSRKYRLCTSFVSYSTPRLQSLNSKFKGCYFVITPGKHKQSSLAAVVGGTIAVLNTEHYISSSDACDPSTNHGEMTSSDKMDEKDDTKALDEHRMTRVCDKLIDVFMVDKPKTTDWRKLLVFSKEWKNIRPHFFQRCLERAGSEDDPAMKPMLLRLGRKLKEVDEDVQRHNQLLQVIKGAPSEISEIVARRRKDFTNEFFEHVHTVAESYYDNPTERDAVVKLKKMCLAAVRAYDTASGSIDALNARELNFEDILNSSSVDAASRKIDNLAEKNRLDSARSLLFTKAWSGARQTNLVEEEVKDMMYDQYITAVGNQERLLPKEVRILKYLLTLKDPEEQRYVLKNVFTPGEQIEGENADFLYTTPKKLHNLIKSVVNAYNFSRPGTLQAKVVINPMTIIRMEALKKLVEDEFM